MVISSIHTRRICSPTSHLTSCLVGCQVTVFSAPSALVFVNGFNISHSLEPTPLCHGDRLVCQTEIHPRRAHSSVSCTHRTRVHLCINIWRKLAFQIQPRVHIAPLPSYSYHYKPKTTTFAHACTHLRLLTSHNPLRFWGSTITSASTFRLQWRR